MRKLTATTLFLVATAILWLPSSASAQPRPDKDWKSWFGHFGGSFTMPQGDAGDILDDGFSLRGGATYWPESWNVGLVFEIGFGELDISDSTLGAINDAIEMAGGEGRIDGGDVTTTSFTLNATWSPSRSGSGFYLIAGIGAYYVEGQLTEDALLYFPPICDPWFWWCTPGGVGPGSNVLARTSSTELGWNAGVGWAFEVGSGSQFFIEARYLSIDTSPRATEFLPLTVGFRW